MKITNLTTQAIHDSRGVPTIEVIVETPDATTVASVPSGKSTSGKAAVEKRDADGRGVHDALRGITDIIAPAVCGRAWNTLQDVDTLLLELDGTENKSVLGANATLAVSIAVGRAFARSEGVPLWRSIAEMNDWTPSLPRLYMNVINGGVHADFCSAFQEHILVIESDRIADAYNQGVELFNALGKKIKDQNGDVPLGDEGGYALRTTSVENALELLYGLSKNLDTVALAIDVAASELYENGTYTLYGVPYSRGELGDMYHALTTQFDLLSIEDPFAEDDLAGFQHITEALGGQTYIVGDDLTATNPVILKDMIHQQAGNALIIKPNQIGTLTEVYETVKIAHAAGWKCIVSHRSGETLDDWVADLAVAMGAFGIKAGAPSQPERRAKYNRLMKIEEEMIS